MNEATNRRAHEPAAPRRQVARLLVSITDELQELNALALTIQTVLGSALAHRSEDASIHRAAQSLDLITQRIDGLGVFLATLITDVPETWHLDCGLAADSVKLGALARRLMGTRETTPIEDGAVEYF